MTAKPRVVVDTQIFLRATINRRSLPGKLVYDLAKQYVLVASIPVLDEIADVLHLPELRIKLKTLNDNTVRPTLGALARTEMVAIEDYPQVSRDPKDDIFLATAIAGNADYIVTEDQDLLVLNPYEGIQIVNALDFLRVLESSSGSQG